VTTVLVVGATGPTGSAAVRELVARRVRVRVLTRDRAKAAAMPELAGAEVVVGDSSQPDTLEHALGGVGKVYLVPPLAPGWNVMQTGLIDAARRAGVRHVARISAIGAGPDEPSMSLAYHWQGEQELEASGMAWTHLRGNSFSQNTLYEAATIRAEGRFYDCVGDAPFAKVDTRDIGEIVAKVLTEDGHEGQTYELTGPQPLTYAEMAERLSAALGRRIEYVNLSVDERAAQLEAAGLPDWMAREFSSIYGAGFYGAGGGARTTGEVERLLGRPPRPFDDFARDYAAAFA
jgi:uncharacterized protein YbjT (DUF2867 family)